MHKTDRGLPAEHHPCSLLMNAEQLRACRARLQRSSVTGREGQRRLGPGSRRHASETPRGAPAVAVVASESQHSTAGMPSPRARNEMRSGRGRGRCFRASLEANATTKPALTRSPMPSVVRRGRTRRFSTAVRSSSTEVQSTCTLPQQGRDRQRESETPRDVFPVVVLMQLSGAPAGGRGDAQRFLLPIECDEDLVPN